MNALIVVLCIKSDSDRRGKPHSTVEVMTEDLNHDVRIVAVGFAHGPHGTIGADVALKVTPKPEVTPSAHRGPRTREPSHPRPRKRWNTTRRLSNDDI